MRKFLSLILLATPGLVFAMNPLSFHVGADYKHFGARPKAEYRFTFPEMHEGKDLFVWHHLVCGHRDVVHTERISQLGRMVSEVDVHEDDWEKHLIFRTG